MNQKITLKQLWRGTRIFSLVTLLGSMFVHDALSQQVWDYEFINNYQTFEVPSTGRYKLEAWGAGGAEGIWSNQQRNAGKGGYAVGEVSLQAGDILYVYVGEKPLRVANGAAGGGGATDFRYSNGDETWMSSEGLYSRILVAGGGSGSHGGSYTNETFVGAGGGSTATSSYYNGQPSSNPATQSSGGVDNSSANGPVPSYEQDGQFGYAGYALNTPGSYVGNYGGFNGGGKGNNFAVGGGGGGWYGGATCWPQGGGGSGYVLTSSSYRPAGYNPPAQYEFIESELIAGNLSMPDLDGGTMTGKSGHGHARVTQLYSVDLITAIDATCPESADGSVTVVMTGGEAPYTFEWSNGVTTTSGNPIDGFSLLGHLSESSYYRSNVQAATFDEAQTIAESYFGNLVDINSAEENAWLMSNGAQDGDNIGGNDAAVDGTWEWASGEAFSYSNWAPGEPNNGGGNQDYMQLYANGTWDDILWAATADVRHIMELPSVSTIENLAPGDYTVVVTDVNGLETSGTFTVGPDPIEIDFNMTQSSSCDEVGDGGLEAVVTGGNSPYTYVWSSGETVATITNKAIGEYTVTVTDANNCASVQEVGTVLADDNTNPVAIVKSANIYLDEEGNATVTVDDINDGSYDDCAISDMYVLNPNFSCSDPIIFLGLNATLVVVDANGNEAFADADINLIDTIKPVAVVKNIQIELNSEGLATINAADVDDESSDNCQIASRSLSKTAFSCEDLGVNEVTLIVEDGSGNSRSATAQVTVVDNLDPLVEVQNVQVSLDANGSGSIQVSDVEVSSSDNCGIASRVLNNSTFSCADLGEDNEVTLTVTDNSGNATQKTVAVTVSESIDPVAVAEAYTVELDADGEVTLTAAVVAQFIGSGSTDNCGLNAASHALNQMVFSCEDLGANSLTYSVADASGNSDDAPVVITVVDAIAPTALAQNIIAQLNEDGVAVISGLDADNGSTDNCSIVSRELSTNEFTCEELGEHEVTLTVTDASGNESQDTFTVNVVDEVVPVIPEALSISVYLDESGEGVFSTAPLLAQASDNCGLDAIVIAAGEGEEYVNIDGFPFTCEEVGVSSGPLFVRDNSGNLTPFMLQLSVLDTIKPSFFLESIDLELDEEGNAVLTEEMLSQYASDNCSVAEVAIQNSNYDCTMSSAAQYTEIIVFDVNGNATQKTLEVRLKDKMAPQAQVENKTIELNQNGQADLNVGMLDMMVMDNCEAVSFELSQTNFSCEDLGSHTLTMTVADAAGNVGTTDFVITVEDNTAPLVSGPEMIQLCEGVPVSYDEIVAMDNCSVELTLMDGPEEGTMPAAGEFMVEFEAVDGSGNSTTKLVLLDISETPVVDLGGDIEVEEGEIVTLQAGENNTYQYNWSNGSTGPVYAFTAMEDITVSVEVITPDGCTVTDEIFVSVSHPLGIDDDAAGNSVRFYPNPTNGQMSVALSLTETATDVRLNIMDISGKTVTQQIIPTAKDGDVISLDLSNYADGIYLISLQSDSFSITQRVVKN